MAVGKIVATVVADTSGFAAGMKRAGKGAKKFGASAGKAMGQVTKLGAAAAIAGAAIVTALVIKGLAAVDAQAKLARSVGGTQRGLVGLKRAAEDAGITTQEISKSMLNMNKRLGEATLGTSLAADALKTLGLDAEDLQKMDVDERFAALSDAMNKTGKTSGEMSLLMGDLGVKAKNLSVLMMDGGDAIRAASKEMEGYGVAVSEVDAAQVEALNDAMDRGRHVMEGVANQLAVKLAPYIAAVVELMKDASAETGGFGDIIDRVITGTLKGVGYVLDKWQTLKLGMAGLSVVGEMVRAGIMVVLHGIASGVEALADATLRNVNALISGVNKLPGVDIDLIRIEPSAFVNDLKMMSETAEAEAEASLAALKAMANEPLASDSIAEWSEDVKRRAREAAEAVVEQRKAQKENIAKVREEEGSETDKEAAARAAKVQAALQASARSKLQVLQASLRSEVEAENFAHEERLANLDTAHEALALSEQEFMALREDLEAQHQGSLAALREKGLSDAERFSAMSWDNQASHVIGALSSMTQSLGKESRAMFNIQKAVSISQAVMSTFEGANKALALYGGGPLGIAMMAVTIAAGLANVAAIKSQTFGGGGSKGGGGGGGAAAAAPAGPPGGTLSVSGISPDSLFTGAAVTALADELLEYQRQGGTVVLQS